MRSSFIKKKKIKIYVKSKIASINISKLHFCEIFQKQRICECLESTWCEEIRWDPDFNYIITWLSPSQKSKDVTDVIVSICPLKRDRAEKEASRALV